MLRLHSEPPRSLTAKPKSSAGCFPPRFTKRVVAKLIGFCRTKTYELVQDGKIPSITVKGRNADQSKSVGCLDRSTKRDPERADPRSEEHTSELQSLRHLVCRLLLE